MSKWKLKNEKGEKKQGTQFEYNNILYTSYC